MYRLILCAMLLVLGGCAIFETRLDVTDADIAFTLAQMEIDAGSIPGAPKLDAEACMMLIRNAKLLTSGDLKEVLNKLVMETDGCSWGKPETEARNAGIRR